MDLSKIAEKVENKIYKDKSEVKSSFQFPCKHLQNRTLY